MTHLTQESIPEIQFGDMKRAALMRVLPNIQVARKPCVPSEPLAEADRPFSLILNENVM